MVPSKRLLPRAGQQLLGRWALIIATALQLAVPAAQAARLEVSSPAGDPGTQVPFTVTFRAEGAMVAGAQIDIAFDAVHTPVAAKSNSKPDCTVNPGINKPETSFAFRPDGCARTNSCTGFRALVLSTSNVATIPDGSILYTCKVNIAAAAAGDYPLTISGNILSDPNGQRVANAVPVSGSISVGGPTRTPTSLPTGTPTRTATPTKTPTATATPCVGTCHGGNAVTIDDLLTMVNVGLGNSPGSACAAGDTNHDTRITVEEILSAVNNALFGCGVPPPSLPPTATRTPTVTRTGTTTRTPTPTPRFVHVDVGSARSAPSGNAQVNVTIHSSGLQTVATGNEITYPSDVFELSGCTINPATHKTLITSVAEQFDSETTIRVLVSALENASPISDGVLYTCTFNVKPSAPLGVFPLLNGSVVAFGPDGSEYESVTGEDGQVTVTLVP